MRTRTTLGLVCLIAVLAMFGGCQQPQQSVDANAPQAEPMKIEAEQPPATPSAKAAPVKKTVAKAGPTTKATAAKTLAPKAATSGASAAGTTPGSTPIMESRTVAMKQDEEAIATTVSGCLEEDNGMFRLKDTNGEHAPKSRSWKSGFIKKGSAKIDVFDAGNRFKLMSHVGYHMSVSGNLVDREMHARSVRVSSERCD
jgi:Tfp pilus assembly major pilin PilA